MPVFCLISYIRIVIEIRDLKILRQILKTIGAAGCAAAVQEKGRNPLIFYVFFNYFVQLALIINPVHNFSKLQPAACGGDQNFR